MKTVNATKKRLIVILAMSIAVVSCNKTKHDPAPTVTTTKKHSTTITPKNYLQIWVLNKDSSNYDFHLYDSIKVTSMNAFRDGTDSLCYYYGDTAITSTGIKYKPTLYANYGDVNTQQVVDGSSTLTITQISPTTDVITYTVTCGYLGTGKPYELQLSIPYNAQYMVGEQMIWNRIK